MKLKVFFILIIFLFTCEIFAQPTVLWTKRFSYISGYDNKVIDMVLDSTGNIYLSGYIIYSSFRQDLLTIKFNSSGELVWATTFPGSDNIKLTPVAIKIDKLNNVIISAIREMGNANDYLTLKYNYNGDTVWVRRFNSLGDTATARYAIPRGLAIDESNNIYVTGVCDLGGPSNFAIGTIKYNYLGELQWFNYRMGFGAAIIINKYNYIFVSGGYNVWNTVYKFDSSGNQKWYSKDTIFWTVKSALDKNNNYYLGGGVLTDSTGEDVALIKYDSSGNRKWIRTEHQISTSKNDLFSDFVVDSLENVYVTSKSAHLNQIGWDFVTMKYNKNGDTNWLKIYNPYFGSDDSPNSIDIDKSLNVFVAGSSNPSNLIGHRYTTVIYNNYGQQKYVLFYDNNLQNYEHEAIKIKVAIDNNFVVTGNSMNSNGIYEIATLKYSAITGIHNYSNIIPKENILFQNYPNPFNFETKIKFNIATSILNKATLVEVSLKIYDILGREIKTLVNEQLIPGTYEIILNGNNLSSGIYFYSLVIENNKILTKKFILLN